MNYEFYFFLTEVRIKITSFHFKCNDTILNVDLQQLNSNKMKQRRFIQVERHLFSLHGVTKPMFFESHLTLTCCLTPIPNHQSLEFDTATPTHNAVTHLSRSRFQTQPLHAQKLPSSAAFES